MCNERTAWTRGVPASRWPPSRGSSLLRPNLVRRVQPAESRSTSCNEASPQTDKSHPDFEAQECRGSVPFVRAADHADRLVLSSTETEDFRVTVVGGIRFLWVERERHLELRDRRVVVVGDEQEIAQDPGYCRPTWAPELPDAACLSHGLLRLSPPGRQRPKAQRNGKAAAQPPVILALAPRKFFASGLDSHFGTDFRLSGTAPGYLCRCMTARLEHILLRRI